MKKTRILSLLLIILLIGGAMTYLGHVFGYEPDPVIIEVPTTYQISSSQLPRQTPYNCGPYNVYMIAAMDPKFKDSAEDLVSKIDQWKIPKLGFLPFHIRHLLSSVNLQASISNFRYLDDQDRLDVLAAEISQDNPVILLVKKHGYQHYITLLGYDLDQDLWHIYDPMLSKSGNQDTVDTNNKDTGNETLSGDELLHLWSGGGMLSFFKWYAMTVTKNK